MATIQRTNWKRRAKPQFTAPDGSAITMSGDLDTTGGWSCLFKAVVAGDLFGFTIAEARSVDWYVEHVMKVPVRATSPFRGGTLRSVCDRASGEVVNAWTGPWWGIQFGTTGKGPVLAAARATFEAMRLRDTPAGLVVGAWGKEVVPSSCSVFKEVGELGDLQIDRPGGDVRLPAWKGRRTRSGEIWAQSLKGQGRRRDTALVLGTPTAVGTLIPGPDSTKADARALSAMDSLDLRWD